VHAGAGSAAAATTAAAATEAKATGQQLKQQQQQQQPQPVANLVSVLRSRGLIQDITSDELEKVAADVCLPIYCGFDPTADSLHLGEADGQHCQQETMQYYWNSTINPVAMHAASTRAAETAGSRLVSPTSSCQHRTCS
jgi:hypothetical protein